MAGYTGPLVMLAQRFAATPASGAPVSGRYEVGDYAIDATGAVFVCIVAGAPGTWVANPFNAVTDATKLPLAGGTMSGPIAMGANKITGLANGSASTDAAAYGQLPTLSSLGGMATATYDPAAIAQQLVGTTASQTLTNKTLTSPVIATITNTGTVTLPTASDTLVARATTDTLSNKRVTRRVYAYSAPGATPTINTDTYDVVNMTALAAAITSMTTNLSGSPNSFDSLILGFTDNGTARAITWGTSFEASTVALPTTTVISALLLVGFLYNPTTSKWRCVAVA